MVSSDVAVASQYDSVPLRNVLLCDSQRRSQATHRVRFRLGRKLLLVPQSALVAGRILLEADVSESASNPKDAVEPISRDVSCGKRVREIFKTSTFEHVRMTHRAVEQKDTTGPLQWMLQALQPSSAKG